MLEYIDEIVKSTEITPATACLRLFLSLLFGTIIGAERQLRRRDAGVRTFSLICMGSAAAMLVSIWLPQIYPDFLNGDPGRIAAQVLTGIGFLGAGAIIQSRGSIQGLTTAACIWVMAVIGLAVGAGLYVGAAVASLFTLFILLSLEKLEKRLFLDGVNKILTIYCNTTSPDLDIIRYVLQKNHVFIISFSYENDYTSNSSIITYKVNVKSTSSYSGLFREIKEQGYVTQIKLFT
ncbi:MAG: MgtC/SapB family protein [Tannerellaceae bacterium]|nr:MgtC/SapB family protein [Tannerellaceae bacterium]